MARGYAKTSLGQIHYLREGTGAPLVLLAASGRSSRMFKGLIQELRHSFDVIAFDAPGFGNSDPLPSGTTIEQLADAFTEALDDIGIGRVALYGLHTGNKIATAMATRHPNRLSKLMLAGQSHSLIPDQETRNAGIRDIIQSYVDVETQRSGAKSDSAVAAVKIEKLICAMELGTGAHRGLGGQVLDHILDEIEATGTAALYLANFRYDLGSGYAEIRVPTLVLEIETAAETRDVGLQGPQVSRLIRGSTLVTLKVPDGDALTLEDRPKDLAAIIKAFLD
jgi:pimeloyl-ACP methyl ester carboxylesterase